MLQLRTSLPRLLKFNDLLGDGECPTPLFFFDQISGILFTNFCKRRNRESAFYIVRPEFDAKSVCIVPSSIRTGFPQAFRSFPPESV